MGNAQRFPYLHAPTPHSTKLIAVLPNWHAICNFEVSQFYMAGPQPGLTTLKTKLLLLGQSLTLNNFWR